MPVGDLLNWDFILPRYTDKQKEEFLKEIQKKRQELQKEVKDYEKNMNKVRYMEKSSYITFSTVLEMMKKYRQHNLRFRRTGWNGKDMYITLQCPDENSKMTQPYIYMKTADDNLVPWVASQTDLLAEDWEQLPENYDEINDDDTINWKESNVKESITDTSNDIQLKINIDTTEAISQLQRIQKALMTDEQCRKIQKEQRDETR
jgi:hypothetical protein